MTACTHLIEGDNAYTDPSGRTHCKECRARRDRDSYAARKAAGTRATPVGATQSRSENGSPRTQLDIIGIVRPPYPWERVNVTRVVEQWTADDAERAELLQCLGLADYKRNALGKAHK